MTTSTAAPATATPETRPAPVEVTTPIRPSEAIRLGCLTTRQKFGGIAYYSAHSACVVGAGTIGMGFRHSKGPSEFEGIVENDPRLPYHCPAVGCVERPQLVHLNDEHRWSRERIADWLESLGL